MFKALPTGTRLEFDLQAVAALQRSDNTPTVAIGPGPARPVRCWLVGAELPGGLHQVAVWLVPEDRPDGGGLLFRCDPPQVGRADYEDLMLQAVEMVQQQGFDMRYLDVDTASESTFKQWMSVLPLSVPAPLAPVTRRAHRSTAPSGMFPTAVNQAADLPSGLHAVPVEISREISLPDTEVVRTLGTLLTLF